MVWGLVLVFRTEALQLARANWVSGIKFGVSAMLNNMGALTIAYTILGVPYYNSIVAPKPNSNYGGPYIRTGEELRDPGVLDLSFMPQSNPAWTANELVSFMPRFDLETGFPKMGDLNIVP